ncbi:MAG: HAD family hydrolase [Acidimicrobiales bacterium]
MARVLLDFDGTLAHSPGRWRQCLIDVLDELAPGHTVGMDDVRPHLRGGFPWHRHHEPHPHLDTADSWWQALDPLLSRAFEGCGLDPALVPRAVDAVRASYCDPGRFELYPDTRASLELLRCDGHQLVILSNHVPELPDLVGALGIADLVSEVHTSAVTGYEKPHPEAYRIGLAGTDPADAWMVGDNPEADINGAERVGVRAILVRHLGAPGLLDAAHRITGGGS